MSDQQQAQQNFLAAIEAQMRTMLGSQLNGELRALIYPPGFNFQTTVGPNAYFNPLTLKVLDFPTIDGGNGAKTLDSTDSYSGLYMRLLKSASYQLSSADNTRVQKALDDAAAQQQALISAWEDAYGPIRLDGTGFANKALYINDVVRKEYGNDPSRLDGSVRIVYLTWALAAAPALTVKQAQFDALQRLSAAAANVLNPSASNGGLQVEDGSYVAAFDNIPTPTELLGRLRNAGNTVTVKASVACSESGTTSMSAGGGAGVTIPLDFLSISVGGSAQYNLDKMMSRNQSMSIEMAFTGVTPISPSPRVLSANGQSGWYDKVIVDELARNKAGEDFTGFYLSSDEWKGRAVFGPQGRFTRARTLVLSQRPTVTLRFHKADASSVKSMFQENVGVKLNLFGLIPLGHAEQSYKTTSARSDDASGDVVVTFGPDSFDGGTVNARDRTCYIVGAVLEEIDGK
ncbi:hypothetical protein KZ686_11425 [Cupriavidus cauae]|uniref:hypothetical protein n=1 Tax=Cupriavidus cauae TaxID=2608999 RepID=UPI002243DF4A|nr:hypothetical protein [Cupriavidus cauae]UZN48404.1 hypothetical protein KZ686_11425 [Cupriavidus cauae]